MNDHNEKFYTNVLVSKPYPDSLPAESLSIKFLQENGSKVRLIHESNILETFNIAEAFSKNASGYLMTNEESFQCRPVEINIEFLCEDADPLDNNNSLIIADAELKNFMVILNDHETIWLVGDEKFLKKAQPYPLEIMKDYYLTWLDDDPDDPTAKEFWSVWNEYKPFMLK